MHTRAVFHQARLLNQLDVCTDIALFTSVHVPEFVEISGPWKNVVPSNKVLCIFKDFTDGVFSELLLLRWK